MAGETGYALRRMTCGIRGTAPALVALGFLACTVSSACSHSGSSRREGRWKGTSAEGVAPEAASRRERVRGRDGDRRARRRDHGLSPPHDKQSGTYKVLHEDKGQVTIVTDKDAPNDTQTFTLVDDKTLKWSVLDGKTITFARA